MRLKIEGLVTRERLLEAYDKALQMLGPDAQGIYNVNMYLNAYDKNGRFIRNFIVEGEPCDLLFTAPKGELLRPQVTSTGGDDESGGAQDEALAERQKQVRAEAQAAHEAHVANITLKRERREQAIAEQDRRDVEFFGLAGQFGRELQDALNAVIEQVWYATTPRFSTGKMRGKFRPMPFVEFRETGVYLYWDKTDTKVRKIGSIMSLVQSYPDVDGNYLKPYWAYPEWKDQVVPRLAAILDTFRARLAPDRPQQDLDVVESQ